jgi:hypothetical protein
MVKEAVVTDSQTNSDVLVADGLSDAMVKAGEVLIGKLDSLNFLVDAALWFFLPEENVWRFLIASPEVRRDGPRKAYKKVQTAIGKVPEGQPKIALKDVTVLDSKDQRIDLLRKAIKTRKSISGLRIIKSVINGTLLEDAYIYRLI